jgi:hypothetical protein
MKQMDNLLFQQSQTIDEIKNRLNCIESGSLNSSNQELDIKSCLMTDPEFVGEIVDNIMTNSNLSEIIEQIETVQTENRELRELLYAQQKTINEINIMLLKLMSQGLKGNGKDQQQGQQQDQQQGQQQDQPQDQQQDQQQDQPQDQQQDQPQDQQQDQPQDQEGQEEQDQEGQEEQDQEGQDPNVALEIQDK